MVKVLHVHWYRGDGDSLNIDAENIFHTVCLTDLLEFKLFLFTNAGFDGFSFRLREKHIHTK